MIVPPVNTKGIFEFKEPFSNTMKANTVYTVTSVRSIPELFESGEDPYEYIYKIAKLTEEDFKEDMNNDVPIVVFSTNGTDFYYVPATYILSTPKLIGHRYREFMIGIKLGLLPVETHTDHVLEILKNDIRDTIGPDTIANIVPSSAEVLLDDIEDSTRRRLLEHSKTVYKSYKTRYLEEVERNKELQKRLEIVERELARYIN